MMGQLMTAFEARDKWCRHVRKFGFTRYGEGAGAAGYNRGKEDNTRCLGPERCPSWDWWDPDTVPTDERRGYCAADPQRPNKIGNKSNLDKERRR